jgi:hypothetical protein
VLEENMRLGSGRGSDTAYAVGAGQTNESGREPFGEGRRDEGVRAARVQGAGDRVGSLAQEDLGLQYVVCGCAFWDVLEPRDTGVGGDG